MGLREVGLGTGLLMLGTLCLPLLLALLVATGRTHTAGGTRGREPGRGCHLHEFEVVSVRLGGGSLDNEGGKPKTNRGKVYWRPALL